MFKLFSSGSFSLQPPFPRTPGSYDRRSTRPLGYVYSLFFPFFLVLFYHPPHLLVSISFLPQISTSFFSSLFITGSRELSPVCSLGSPPYRVLVLFFNLSFHLLLFPLCDMTRSLFRPFLFFFCLPTVYSHVNGQSGSVSVSF